MNVRTCGDFLTGWLCFCLWSSVDTCVCVCAYTQSLHTPKHMCGTASYNRTISNQERSTTSTYTHRLFPKNTTSPPQRDFGNDDIVYDLPVICTEGSVGDVLKGSRVECVHV